MRDSTAESVKVEPESILGRAGQATALLEALPVGVCVCDAHSSAVLWHNKAAERLWGGPPKHAITGDPVVIDQPHGGRVAILGRATPLRDASGQLLAILNTLEDVTQLHDIRAELREVQEWRRLALDTADLGTYDLDFVSQHTVCSDRARAILGIPTHVPVDVDLARSLIHPEDRAHVQRMGREAADPRGSGSYIDEFRIVRPDGEVRSILNRGTILFEGEGAGRRPVRLFGAVLDITERKHTDAALRDSEQRMRLALSAAQMGAWEFDLGTGVETWWRPPDGAEPGTAGLGLTGDAKPAIFPEDVERIQTAMRITVATDAPYDIEYRRIEPDGRLRWIHSVGRAVRGADGHALRLAGVARDVTERRSVQAALQEANDRLETLVNASPLPIITFAPDGKITRWNPAAEQVFGWTEQEVLGKPLPFIPEDKIEESQAMRARELRGENLTNLELRRRRKDGSRIDVQVSTAPIRNAQGEIIAVVAIYVDVTAQRRIQRELEDSGARLRLALEAGHMGAWEWDVETNAVLWSEGLTAAMGFAPGAGPHTFDEFVAAIHPDDRVAVQQAIQRTLEADVYYDIEFRVASPNGIRWAARKGRVLRDPSGQPQRMIGVGMDVTERKRTEEALRQQADLLEQAHEAILVWELDGPITYWNRGAEALYGYTAKETIGFNPHALLLVGSQAELEQRLWRLRTEGLWTGQLRHHTRSGRDIVVESRQVLVRTTDALLLVLETNRDITARERAERALRASEEKFRTIFNVAAVGIAQTSVPDGRYISANQRFAEITGYPLEELIGKNFLEITHPDDRSPNQSLYIETMHGGESEYAMEKRYIRKDGSVVWASVTISFVRDESGQPLYTIGVIQDITERKTARIELEESEHRQRLAVDAGGIGLWDWDIAKNRIEWSDRTYEFHGIPLGTFSGSVEEYARQIHPEDRDRVWNAIQRALAGEPYQIEFRVVQPSGEIRWLNTSGAVLADSGGTPVRMFGATMDVTERRAAEEVVQRVNAELRRANADLQQFAYAAAHDLQEPLRNVALYTQLLAFRYENRLDGDADEILSITRDSATRMQALVQDLLTYTRVIGSDQPPTPVDCNRVFRSVLQNLSAAVVESRATITSGALPEIRAHESSIVQVFQNLISNAIKYRGEAPLRIHVDAERHSNGWLFSISDNGIGIAPEYQERIFGVFKRLHGREIAGTGIGLAICRRMVEKYGGRIWVESPGEGKGSTFRFTIAQAG